MALRLKSAISLVLFVLISTGGLSAQQETLDRAIHHITLQPHFKYAHWGALFVDQDSGQVVYEHNADKLFAPASTTKLFSVACALDALGADYRFQTPVVRKGDVDENGDLKGDLILIASGDLTFGGRTTADGKIDFRNVDHTYANGNLDALLTDPDPLSGLNDLAKQVHAAGIKRVRGDVLIDDRLFEKAESSGSGPSKVTPIMINDNVIDITITPAEVGHAAQISVRPDTAAIHLESKVMTCAHDKSMQMTIRDVGHGRILVAGEIPHGHKPVIKIHEVPDPNAYARSLFIEALQRAGVTVDASTFGEAPVHALPSSVETRSLPQVALFTSPPFSESAKLILKVSHNLHASTLPLLVAQKFGERTVTEGLKRQAAFLKQAGVDVDSISFSGAAGGARGDFVTPRATVELLQYMVKRPDFASYREALPRLGIDGTLATNIPKDSPAHGKVQAKTGTLYWENTMNGSTLMTSKALAGYMTTAKGKKLIFALFVNNAHLRERVTTKTFGDDLARICEIVYLRE
jgi:D-alanyl-D-alanine carboxypeptidase/D-alanyl-D-alanine-endopeptidase (penicillin-binding protein 4)